MTDYGLKIKDANGNVLLDTSDIIARIRYAIIAASGSSDSVVLGDIAGKTAYACAYIVSAGLPHSVSISGTTFSWAAQSNARAGSADTLVFVVLED